MESLSIALYGIGKVGRALVRTTPHYFRYTVIADRSGAIAKKDGFTNEELENIVNLKKEGGKLKDLTVVGGEFTQIDFIFENYISDILVDVSTDQSYDVLLRALEKGIHVNGSNKQPYSDTSFSQYQKLFETAKRAKVILDNRTVVSANLGILPRISEFVDTGSISHVIGCLSGTMSYVSYRINQHILFSQAIHEAVEKDYTESDERDDITGKDFKRKVVIIARRAGAPIELYMVSVDTVIPKEFLELPLEEFRRRLPELDDEFKAKVKKAQDRGCTYRFVGSLDFDTNAYQIGFREIPLDDPQATVQDCYNKVTMYPKEWNGKSLTIEGPGAGIQPTVQGLRAGLFDVSKLKERLS